MAIASGTLATLAALSAAGATVASSKMQSNTANKSTKAQLAANDAALAYQREQDLKAEKRQAEIDAREREIEAKAEQAWNAEQARLAPLRALKEALAGQTAGRIGLPFDVSGLGEAKAYPGSGGDMGAGAAPLSSIRSNMGVRANPASVSPALPDPAEISEQDPYTMPARRLADIARGGWRLGR